MIHLCDSNVLVALAVGQHIHHPVAKDWFEQLVAEDQVGICRATQTSFLRLLTQKIADTYEPVSNRDAWYVYETILSDDAVCWVPESDHLDGYWKSWSDRKSASPKLWMDAYLASFAHAHNMNLVTFDKTFMQFKGISVTMLRK